MSLVKQVLPFESVLWLVNPDFVGNVWRFRFAFDKSSKVVAICLVEYVLSLGFQFDVCQPVVHGIGCGQAQAAVTVLGVVPGKEDLEVGAHFLRTREAPGV